MAHTKSPSVMGIINLNPDSFYTESRCTTEKQIEERFEMMVREDADIIDLGACSTRPGLKSIPEDLEWEYLKPGLKVLMKSFPQCTVSIDTFRASIVERAYDFIGDFIVNDISAGEDDSGMLDMVARLELPYIAMHKRGTPETMQSYCQYNDVVKEVRDYFVEFINKATDKGIKDLTLDPGFGFAKDISQNYQLLERLPELKIEKVDGSGNWPILVGISRKSMIHKFLGITPEESLPATTALNLQAIIKGADILRVHDVREARQIVKIFTNFIA